MYSKKYRLPIGTKRVAGGQTFSSQYFSVKSRGNDERHNRFGIIISNHSVKESAKRHFWKRVVADALQAWPNLQKDFLVIASPKIKTADKEAVRAEIAKALKFFGPRV